MGLGKMEVEGADRVIAWMDTAGSADRPFYDPDAVDPRIEAVVKSGADKAVARHVGDRSIHIEIDKALARSRKKSAARGSLNRWRVSTDGAGVATFGRTPTRKDRLTV